MTLTDQKLRELARDIQLKLFGNGGPRFEECQYYKENQELIIAVLRAHFGPSQVSSIEHPPVTRTDEGDGIGSTEPSRSPFEPSPCGKEGHLHLHLRPLTPVVHTIGPPIGISSGHEWKQKFICILCEASRRAHSEAVREISQHYRVWVNDDPDMGHAECVCGGAVANGTIPYAKIWQQHILALDKGGRS